MAHTQPKKRQRRPGSWDTCHTGLQFYSDNDLGIPKLEPFSHPLPEDINLAAYNVRDDSGDKISKTIAHFFLDDFRFESVWLRPQTGLTRVGRFWGALTPDFSLYTDWPLAAQIYNTYRSRWIGCYWQRHGIAVIPTVSWSTAASFEFCFLGIEPNSPVAISVPDLRDQRTKHLFIQGFAKLQQTLEPSLILSYGRLPFNCKDVLDFPPDWLKLRHLTPRD